VQVKGELGRSRRVYFFKFPMSLPKTPWLLLFGSSPVSDCGAGPASSTPATSPSSTGAVAVDWVSLSANSRKEEKAPAREEPTTGEAPLIASQSSQGIGAGAGASDKKEIHFADKDTQSTATAPVELGEVAGCRLFTRRSFLLFARESSVHIRALVLVRSSRLGTELRLLLLLKLCISLHSVVEEEEEEEEGHHEHAGAAEGDNDEVPAYTSGGAAPVEVGPNGYAVSD
jgi:hypothetical protein